MSVLTIRSHSRFAVSRHVALRVTGRKSVNGLVIELSLDGARVSHVAEDCFAPGQIVTFGIDGADPIEARIRWRRDTTIGLRFIEPLHAARLQQLIRLCREPPTQDRRAYGT